MALLENKFLLFYVNIIKNVIIKALKKNYIKNIL
jgi:hypothetical protein